MLGGKAFLLEFLIAKSISEIHLANLTKTLCLDLRKDFT